MSIRVVYPEIRRFDRFSVRAFALNESSSFVLLKYSSNNDLLRDYRRIWEMLRLNPGPFVHSNGQIAFSQDEFDTLRQNVVLQWLRILSRGSTDPQHIFGVKDINRSVLTTDQVIVAATLKVLADPEEFLTLVAGTLGIDRARTKKMHEFFLIRADI